MQIDVRDERPDDIPAVHALNQRAFGQEQEANIVDALRRNGAARLSLVATLDGLVVGHVLYSPGRCRYRDEFSGVAGMRDALRDKRAACRS